MQQIPMYVFTGFLESGKTKFIQETLEDPRFNSGEKTLLLVLEEGEEEYDLSRYLMLLLKHLNLCGNRRPYRHLMSVLM